MAAQNQAASPIALVRLLEDLIEANDLPSLERSYLKHASEFIDLPLRGLYTFTPSGQEVASFAGDGVSDYFLARYEEAGRAIDPVLHHTLNEVAPADTRMFVSVEEWPQHALYQEVLHLHAVAYVIQAPVVGGDGVAGTLVWASDSGRPSMTCGEQQTATAIGRIVGLALDLLRERTLAERISNQLAAALDQSASPIAITDLTRGHRHLNASAKSLLNLVADGSRSIDRLMVRSGGSAPRSVEGPVQLLDGSRSKLHIRSEPLREIPAATISTLRLAGAAHPQVKPDLTSLTGREREVAQLVADGLTDPEIAERLFLSRHTVRQYVKAIYRKLGVNSRVGLARVLLGADPAPPNTT